jgi:hypothetical protein
VRYNYYNLLQKGDKMKTLDEQLSEIKTLTSLLTCLNSAKFIAEKSNYGDTKVTASFSNISWSETELVQEFVSELNEAIKPLIEKRKNILRATLAGLAIREL